MADVRLSRRGLQRAVVIGAMAAAAASGAGCGPAGAAPGAAAGSEGSVSASASAPGAAAGSEASAAGVVPPPGWQVLPPLAFTAKAALGAGGSVEAVEAWGEPAKGCYAVWIAVRAAGGAEAVGAQIAAGFAGEVERSAAQAESAGSAGARGAAAAGSGGSGAGGGPGAGGAQGADGADGAGGADGGGGSGRLVVRDVVVPRGEAGVLSLAFAQGEHRGRLRARLDGERIAALACFANQREPIACETACNGLLGAIK